MKDIYIDSIQQYNDYFGFETVHPLVSVVHCDGNVKPRTEPARYHYGLYAIILKETKGCSITYGRTQYDFDEMTITSFAPGQVITVNPIPGNAVPPKWTAIVFHPDFLARTNLGREISKYGFFSYSSVEALHLSSAEVEIVRSVLNIIKQEMNYAIDHHSRKLIVANIEVLLGYCLRFYERQFVTREEINHKVVKDFEYMLTQYIKNEAEDNGIPSVAFFAEKCNLTPGYFGELVKTETGQTAQSFISEHMVTVSKELLSDAKLSVSQVALKMGFDYPQHFVRFFKRHTGKTPSQYRLNFKD